MSDDGLTWIKHDGGPMPVPGDTMVLTRRHSGNCRDKNPQSAGWWDDENPVDSNWSCGGLSQIAEYAIVTPSPTAPTLTNGSSPLHMQEGGSHYKDMPIQPVQYAMANGLGFIEGCVVKYVTRYKAKGGVEDLRKARHFLDILIDNVERGA